MQVEVEAILLSAEAKPYDFNGNKGTSYKIRLSVGGEIFVCKSDESQVSEMEKFEGKRGNAVVEVVSRKERLSLELRSFVV